MPAPSVYISPTGRRVNVEPADVQMYERLGYTPETQREQTAVAGEQAREDYYTNPTEQVSSVVEGVISGATGGLYDIAAGPDSETARRARYNPGKRLAAEIAGGFVGTALPFGRGVSALTRPAEGAGFLAKSVGAAAEGSIYGAGASVAQARLNDDPLTVETLIHGVGPGALLGLGANTLAAGIQRAGKNASGRVAAEAVEDLERSEAIQLAEQRVAAAEEVLKAPDPSQYGSVDRAVRPHWDSFRTNAREAVTELTSQVRQAEDALSMARERGTFSSAAEDALSTVSPDLPGFQAGMDSLAAPATPSVGAQQLKAVGDDLLGQIASLEPATQKTLGGPISRLRKAASAVDSNPEAYRAALKDLGERSGISVEVPEIASAKRIPVTRDKGEIAAEMYAANQRTSGWIQPAVRSVAAEADAAMNAAIRGGDTSVALKAASSYFKVLERAKLPQPKTGWASMGEEGVKMALNAMDEAKTVKQVAASLRNLRGDFTQMTRPQIDRLAAAVEKASTLSTYGPALRESVDQLMKGAGVLHDGSLAERLYATVESLRAARVKDFHAREAFRGEKAAHRARVKSARIEMDRANKELKRLSKEAKEPREKARKTVVERLANYMVTILGAKFGGAHLGGGLAGRGAGVIVAHGVARTNGVIGGVLGARARLTSGIDNALARWGGQGSSMVRRGVPAYAQILRHTTLYGNEDEGGTLPELVKRRIAELDKIMAVLPDQAYAASAWLDDDSPEASKAMQAWFTNALTYLQSVAPKNPGTVWVAGKDRWMPSDVKSREFADRWFGAFEPVEAGLAFLRGEASAATVQSLANTNPGIYNYFRNQMVRHLTDPLVLGRLTRDQRSQASWFTGVPMDSLEETSSVEFFQQQFAQAQAASRVPPPPANSGGRPPGADEATQSQAQRLTYR